MTQPRSLFRAAPRFAALGSLLTITLVAGPSLAQDPFAVPPPAEPGQPIPGQPLGTTAPVPEGVKGEVHQSLARPNMAEAEEPPPIGPVERLPPTAYPEWKVRGIYGGSLWLSPGFNGMPWPYYPKTGIGISGAGWVDTGYEQINRGTADSSQPSQTKYALQQGRAVLRVTPTFSTGRFYVQGDSEFIANKDQTVTQPNVVDIDDLWIRTGYWHQWDLTVGRFEGFEVYHFGMGLDLNTLERNGAADGLHAVPTVRGLNWGALRPPNVGNFALHYYWQDTLRLELLVQAGNEGGLNRLGARPAVVYDLGWLKLKGAVNYDNESAVQSTSKESRLAKGAVGAVQFVFAPRIEFGFNFDYSYVDHYNVRSSTAGSSKGDYDPAGSFTTIAFGGFCNAMVMKDTLVGVGVNYITETDQAIDLATGENGKYWHLQAFAAAQYLIGKQLFVKGVIGYARAHLDPTTDPYWDNSMVSFRVRLLYLF